jgi:hypothetical protein
MKGSPLGVNPSSDEAGQWTRFEADQVDNRLSVERAMRQA